MNSMTLKHKIIIALGLILVAIVGRLVPHLWNMTPIAGVAILAGARLGLRWGTGVALVAMFLSDLVIGFYTPVIMISVYACLALSGVIGYFIKDSQKISKIIFGSFSSTVIFFLVTNAAVWQWSLMYSHTLVGLSASYLAGIPFFGNQIIGDLFFTMALFTAWEMGKLLVEKFKLVKIKTQKEKLI